MEVKRVKPSELFEIQRVKNRLPVANRAPHRIPMESTRFKRLEKSSMQDVHMRESAPATYTQLEIADLLTVSRVGWQEWVAGFSKG